MNKLNQYKGNKMKILLKHYKKKSKEERLKDKSCWKEGKNTYKKDSQD